MKVITATLACALSLAACTMTRDAAPTSDGAYPSGADGTWCGAPAASGPVYIEIRYAGDGTPSAVPDRCTVDAGTDITWRGPSDDPIAFEIVFPGESAALRGAGGTLMAADAGGRYKVRLNATNAPGEYKYGIRARGKEIDPAIIIRQR